MKKFLLKISLSGGESRWQYWLRVRGGNKPLALLELAACTLAGIFFVYGLFWSGGELIRNSGDISLSLFSHFTRDDGDKSVPVSTAVYFGYALLVLVLFAWARIWRMRPGVLRIFVAAVIAAAVLAGAYFSVNSPAPGLHLRKMADVVTILFIWYFAKSRLMRLYSEGFIFGIKSAADEIKEGDDLHERSMKFYEGRPVFQALAWMDKGWNWVFDPIFFIVFLVALGFWIIEIIFA